MKLEGELVVHLSWDGHAVHDVRIRSTRALDVPRMFVGKCRDDVAATVPLLFSLCARAQAAASEAAMDAARGARRSDQQARVAAARVALEAIGEHVRSLLLDWPRAMGRPPEIPALAAIRRLIESLDDALTAHGGARDSATLAEDLAVLASQSVFGMPAGDWLQLDDIEALRAWMAERRVGVAEWLDGLLAEHATLGASDVAAMPSITDDILADSLAPAMLRDGFQRMPSWGGEPVETGALARTQHASLVRDLQRRWGNGVATRMVARLVELAMLLEQLAAGSPSPTAVRTCGCDAGAATAAVQTARGLLLHRARIEHDRVTDYRIVAPTEWNFHPDGALVRGLRDRRFAGDQAMRTAATLAIQALDPCVASRIEVIHA
ncbi:MAG TPA: nickel-dependent hydrogenase large subunit [Casimicrobiaceae bacterium]|nr:nickel-dependent hydrogenase large subunit [Casimicrobiaceae bacterium]